MKSGWKLTVLDVVAVITIPLVATIGFMLIDGQKIANAELKEIRKEVNVSNTTLQLTVGRVGRLETDVRDIRMILPKFKLKEQYNGQ